MKYVKIEGSRKLSSFIVPMMAQLSDRPAFDNPDWLFEVKWDGYRAIGEVNEKENRLYSRNGLTYNKAYPKVFEALKSIPINVIIDGEIVVLDEKGRPNFQKLQNYTNNDKHVIQYHVFDCLEIDGKSITNLPLVNRKELLRELLPESDIIKYCDHVDGEGKVLFREMQKTHFEGMIAKRKQSKYLVGKRSSDWLKIKNIQTMEAIVVGFTDPKGSRKHFGSLLLGAFKKGKLVFIGGVGTGFTDQSLKDVYAKVKPLIRKSSPLHVPIKQTPDMTWVDPVLVCNIAYAEITDDGSVRHPVFQGLRVDKEPEDVSI